LSIPIDNVGCRTCVHGEKQVLEDPCHGCLESAFDSVERAVFVKLFPNYEKIND
jgi:hypothetical protein